MIFLLAAVLAVVGVILLYLDAQNRRGQPKKQRSESEQHSRRPRRTQAAVADSTAGSAEDHEMAESGDFVDPLDLDVPVEVGYQEYHDDFVDDQVADVETAVPQSKPMEFDSADSTMVIDKVKEEPDWDYQDPSEQVSQLAGDAVSKMDEATDETEEELRVSFRGLPGRVRRERRAWAVRREYQYLKTDDSLVGEFKRGVVGTGMTPRDVVSGFASGYEMHLFDIGQVTIMAVRRRASSDIVFEAHRLGDKTPVADDLIAVQRLSGFQLYGTDQGAVQRFVDQRVAAALAEMPVAVTTVWAEGEWLLAQTPKIEGYYTWEGMIYPLAQLADAAFVLPPHNQAVKPLEFHDCDPTRPMPANPIPVVDVEEHQGQPVLPVVPPEQEHVPLPRRAREDARGVVDKRELGADEVDPIASGGVQQRTDFYGPRVVRDTSMGSLIFNDTPEEGLESR